MDAITAIATDHGLDVLNSALKNTATQYQLIGAEAHDATDDQLAVFYSAEIETSYYDDNGVLTFVIELPVAEDFNRYLYAVQVTDTSDQVVISAPTPKIALATGVGGMLTLKAAVTGEAGEVIFKASDYITESEMNDTWLPPIHAAINGRLTQAQADTLYVPLQNQRNKNFIINGNFDVWQRGTNFTGEVYTADRWLTTSSNHSVTKVTNPFGGIFALNCSAVGGSIPAIKTTVLLNVSGNIYPFEGGDYTLSFDIACDTSGLDIKVYTAWANNSAGTNAQVIDDSIVVGTTTGSNQTIEHTFNPSSTPIVSGNQALIIMVMVDSSNESFTLGRVQLEKGSLKTNFEVRSYRDELKLCEYFGFKPRGSATYIIGVRKVNASSSGSVSSALFSSSLNLPRMRVTPIVIHSGGITLHSESGGQIATLSSISVWMPEQTVFNCHFGAADVTDITQIRFLQNVPFFDAEI